MPRKTDLEQYEGSANMLRVDLQKDRSVVDGLLHQQKRLSTAPNSFSQEKCITDLFLEQVDAHPDHPAVVNSLASWSYRDLAQRSLKLAARLGTLEVFSDDRIGLFCDPSPELLAGVWGILLSGGAYLPLSPDYPDERLQYMIEDSEAKVIVCHKHLGSRLVGLGIKDITVVILEEALTSPPILKNPVWATHTIKPHNLAYVIYTSGTTGKPKGVLIEHRNVVNQLWWLKKTFGLGGETTVLQKTPMSFDAAQWEILAASYGSTVVAGSPGIHKNPEALIAAIKTHKVTTLQCVPTLLQALIDQEDFSLCTSLTHVFCGGEALSTQLARELRRQLPACKLTNLYGPTECTINSSSFTITESILKGSEKTVPIGTPVDNTWFYILDETLQPSPIGMVGELYIGGQGLARGYLNQPELTTKKFIAYPDRRAGSAEKLYKTGDLVYRKPDGTIQYVGRTDNQVKLRGHRIELDEIKSAVETHDWVKHCAVIVKPDPNTGHQNLLAFIELNPKEAALMDQGAAATHHMSKENKAQVLAQLSNSGHRDSVDLQHRTSVDLSGKEPTATQSQTAFARKTYRFFDGGRVTKYELLTLLGKSYAKPHLLRTDETTLEEFGELLRYFGSFNSSERLLPKYAYASPGALNATQMYIELNSAFGLDAGYYYFDPQAHRLTLISRKSAVGTGISLHFVGNRAAIEKIYKLNVREVLEIEVGHIIGLFEQVLPNYGLRIGTHAFSPTVMEQLDVSVKDYYLGSFSLTRDELSWADAEVDVYIQAHKEYVEGLAEGLYHYIDGSLEPVSSEIIQRKHVIAINQATYDRAAFGITVIGKAREPGRAFIDLGRTLHHLQMNDLHFGLMSSGYSSKSGYDLPSAKRIREILGADTGPSYFFVGGKISGAQRVSRGMKEDAVHMKGPAEIVKEDLASFLPDYMLPNRMLMVETMPLTVNGKIDTKRLGEIEGNLARPEFKPPSSRLEESLLKLWQSELKQTDFSVSDNFFELGGNSLLAVSLINRANRELGFSLPLQALFEVPTVEKMARRLERSQPIDNSRLIGLQSKGTRNPIYCWPGLGGYCMNLRSLALKLGGEQPFFGVQSSGINLNEKIYRSTEEMAAQDVQLILKAQPQGPYTLWGYSFGARVAFEAACQLEQAGADVQRLILIAPGSPVLHSIGRKETDRTARFDDDVYLTLLYSVFTGRISGLDLSSCLKTVSNKAEFAHFIVDRNPALDTSLVRRIADVVAETYEFTYSPGELEQKKLSSPITILKATNDSPHFLANWNGFTNQAPHETLLDVDHYGMLRDPGVNRLVAAISGRTTEKRGRVGQNTISKSSRSRKQVFSTQLLKEL